MLNENLKKLLFESQIKIPELAKQTGVKAPVLYKIVSGETPNPSIGNITPIANFFNVTVDQLVGNAPLIINSKDLSSFKNKSLVPVIAWNEIPSWDDNYLKTRRENTVSVDFKPSSKTFAILIETDEFFPTFPENTILILDPEVSPFHKSYVIVSSANGSAYLRQVLFDKETLYLKPIIDQIPPSKIQNNEKICGTVLEAKIKFKNH